MDEKDIKTFNHAKEFGQGSYINTFAFYGVIKILKKENGYKLIEDIMSNDNMNSEAEMMIDVGKKFIKEFNL